MKVSEVREAVADAQMLGEVEKILLLVAIETLLPVLRRLAEGRNFVVRWVLKELIGVLEQYLKEEGV